MLYLDIPISLTATQVNSPLLSGCAATMVNSEALDFTLLPLVGMFST